MATANTSYTMNKSKAGGNNYATWNVDIKAVFRRNKLLRYTPVKEEEDSSLTDYINKIADAADIITLTLSDEVENKLSAKDVDDGYKLMGKLKTLCRPDTETAFFSVHKHVI